MKKIWIYVLGMLPFALFYEQLRALTAGPVFLASSVVYLLLVRLVAEKIGRQPAGQRQPTRLSASTPSTSKSSEKVSFKRFLMNQSARSTSLPA